jgi:hypothetical protein
MSDHASNSIALKKCSTCNFLKAGLHEEVPPLGDRQAPMVARVAMLLEPVDEVAGFGVLGDDVVDHDGHAFGAKHTVGLGDERRYVVK